MIKPNFHKGIPFGFYHILMYACGTCACSTCACSTCICALYDNIIVVVLSIYINMHCVSLNYYAHSRFDSPDTASPLSQSEVQAMLQSTRKQIEERKQQTQALVMVSKEYLP